MTLWNIIDKNQWKLEMKQQIYLWAVMIICAVIGSIVWIMCSAVAPALAHGNMLFCFAGYPALIGWVWAIIKLMKMN